MKKRNEKFIYCYTSSPCKGCTDRAVPKTCEKNCKKWQEYLKEKENFDKKELERKNLKVMFFDKYEKLNKALHSGKK